MTNKYAAVKENMMKYFLVRNYLWTCVSLKETLFGDMKQRCPFPFEYDFDTDVLIIHLGNGINISFNFIWNYNEKNKYHLVKIY